MNTDQLAAIPTTTAKKFEYDDVDSILFHGACSKADKRDYLGSNVDNQSTFSNYAFSEVGMDEDVMDVDADLALALMEFAAPLEHAESKTSINSDGKEDNPDDISNQSDTSSVIRSFNSNEGNVIGVGGMVTATATPISYDSGHDSYSVELSELEEKLKAAQAKAAEAQIDSPLVPIKRQPSKKKDGQAGESEKRERVWRTLEASKSAPEEQVSYRKQEKPPLVPAASSLELRKDEHRRATVIRRSTCRQTKIKKALTEGSIQSCSALGTGDKGHPIVASMDHSSIGSSQRTLQTDRTSGSLSPKYIKTDATNHTLLLQKRFRGRIHSIPRLPSVPAVLGGKTPKKKDAKENCSLDMRKEAAQSIEKTALERGNDDGIVKEAFECNASVKSIRSVRRTTKSNHDFPKSSASEDEDDCDASKSNKTMRHTPSRHFLLLSAFSDVVSLRSFRRRPKGAKNNTRKIATDSKQSIAKVQRNANEDKPNAPPSTRATHPYRRHDEVGPVASKVVEQGLERGRSIRTMVTRNDTSNPRHFYFQDPPKRKRIEPYERRACF